MTLKKIYIWFAGLTIALTSCYGDLDPEDLGARNPNASTIYKTVEDYKSGLAKVYASLAVTGQQGPAGQGDVGLIDEGFGQYLRQYWNLQELSTDEAVIGWDDQTIKDIHNHTWTQNDVFVASVYYRIMYTVAVANEFIRAAAASDFEEVKVFHAEARFLRALAYSHAIDLFGNPPFVTESDLPGAFLPKQTTRAELFEYVEQELTDLIPLLEAPETLEYGRADKIAARMVLAKLYLNAEVYINQNRYNDAIAQLNEILKSPYQLAEQHLHNFLADNHTSPEIIFAIAYDGKNTQTYGGTTYLINAQLGGTMPKEQMFGSKSGWQGLRVTSALVDKFEDPSGETDARALFWSDGQSLEIEELGPFTDGWASTKFRNVTKTGATAPNVAYDGGGNTFMDTDFPLFRLADAYLMYAEAVLRGGSGGEFDALTLVNALRERAYGDNSGNISAGDLTLDFILDERGRELFWEAHRRTDLIRFGKFTGSAYIWPWKGGTPDGTGSEAFRALYPLPASDLAANPTLEQNDGYN
jgi:starch-binding outer membrane protein, SusD/RagB family